MNSDVERNMSAGLQQALHERDAVRAERDELIDWMRRIRNDPLIDREGCAEIARNVLEGKAPIAADELMQSIDDLRKERNEANSAAKELRSVLLRTQEHRVEAWAEAKKAKAERDEAKRLLRLWSEGALVSKETERELTEAKAFRRMLRESTSGLTSEVAALRTTVRVMVESLRNAPCGNAYRRRQQQNNGLVGAWHYDVCQATEGGCDCWIGRTIAKAKTEGA